MSLKTQSMHFTIVLLYKIIKWFFLLIWRQAGLPCRLSSFTIFLFHQVHISHGPWRSDPVRPLRQRGSHGSCDDEKGSGEHPVIQIKGILLFMSNLFQCKWYYNYAFSYIHTRQPTNQLLWPGRVKNYPLWLKSVSIPDQPLLYPWCTHAQIPLFPTYPVLPAAQSQLCTTNPRPIPDVTTLNIGPTPDLISTLGLKWIIQANVMSTDSLMWVQYPKCAHDPCY